MGATERHLLNEYDPHNRNRRDNLRNVRTSLPQRIQRPRHQYTRRITVAGDYKLHNFMDMNTPDTEFDSDKEVVGSDCLCVLGSKKHNPECEYATPGTEWTEALQVEVMDGYLHLAEMRHFAKDPVAHMEEMREHWQKLQDFISTLLTSRDTYWKERVRDVKFDIEALRGSPRDTDIEYARAITDVHKILDDIIDNLK